MPRSNSLAARLIRGPSIHLARVAIGAAVPFLVGCATLGQNFDKGYAYLCETYSKGVGVVDSIDRTLGDPRVDDREEKVRVYTRFRTTWTDGEWLDVNASVNARMPFPAIQRRYHLFLDLGTERVVDESGSGEESVDDTDSEERDVNARLQLLYQLRQVADIGLFTRLKWSGGLKAQIGPFASLEGGETPWHWYTRSEVFYDLDDRWCGSLGGNLDYVLGDVGYVRLATGGAVKESQPGLFLNHALSLKHRLGETSAMSYEAGVVYDTRMGSTLGDGTEEVYGLVRWIGRVWRPWLELEVRPKAAYLLTEERMEYSCMFLFKAVYERYLRSSEAPCPTPAPSP
jgi:hypothetical protein